MFHYINENLWGKTKDGTNFDYRAILRKHFNALWDVFKKI
jgi:hypothetical protein